MSVTSIGIIRLLPVSEGDDIDEAKDNILKSFISVLEIRNEMQMETSKGLGDSTILETFQFELA